MPGSSARRPALEASAGLALAAIACAWLARASDAPPGGSAGPALARSVSPPPPALARSGAPPVPSPLPEPPLPVHRTRLVARLDPSSHVVHGEGEILWTNRSSQPVSSVFWHLYLNAFKHPRTAFLRSRLGEGRGGQLPATWGELRLSRLSVRPSREPPASARDLLPALAAHSPGDPEDQTDLQASLPAPCFPGESLVFDLAFDATLPSIVERTGYMENFHMVGQWFPKLARLRDDGSWSHFPFLRLSEFDADFGHYDVTLEVPEGYTVGATGELQEAKSEGGFRRARYLQENVHDFAWTAWDRFQERAEEIEGVRVRALFPPGHEPAVGRQLDGLRVAMRCLNTRLGPYPYRTLTVMQPPSGAGEAGGMEYPTLITTGGAWFGPPWLRSSEAVAVHEYGHQYFYGLLASDEHRYPFLDEGLNSFVEGLCLREGYGAGGLLAAPGLSVDFLQGARWMALGAGHDHAIAHGAAAYPTAGHYGRLAYFRTAALLATVRGAFGEALFDETLRRYAQAYRFRHPEPTDLLATFAQASPPMAAALEEGLARRGWIDAAVTALEPGWALVVRRGTLPLPMTIRLRFADGSARDEPWDGQSEWIRLDTEGPPELTEVEVDPEHRILLDENWSNNRRTRSPAHLGLGSLERASFWGGLLGHLLAP